MKVLFAFPVDDPRPAFQLERAAQALRENPTAHFTIERFGDEQMESAIVYDNGGKLPEDPEQLLLARDAWYKSNISGDERTIFNDISLAIRDLARRKKELEQTISPVAKGLRQLAYDERHSEVCQMPGAEKYEEQLTALL